MCPPPPDPRDAVKPRYRGFWGDLRAQLVDRLLAGLLLWAAVMAVVMLRT